VERPFKPGRIHLPGRPAFSFWAEQRNIDIAIPFARMRYGNALLSRYPLVAARRLPFCRSQALETLLVGKKQGLLCTIKLSGAAVSGFWPFTWSIDWNQRGFGLPK